MCISCVAAEWKGELVIDAGEVPWGLFNWLWESINATLLPLYDLYKQRDHQWEDLPVMLGICATGLLHAGSPWTASDKEEAAPEHPAGGRGRIAGIAGEKGAVGETRTRTLQKKVLSKFKLTGLLVMNYWACFNIIGSFYDTGGVLVIYDSSQCLEWTVASMSRFSFLTWIYLGYLNECSEGTMHLCW